MGTITVEGIQLRAYHGCMEEEAKVGSNYIVDVVVEADFTEAAKQMTFLKLLIMLTFIILLKQKWLSAQN